MTYSQKEIEKKWQKFWEENNTYKFVDEIEKTKFYLLDMFPYPSGQGLHVGHIKGYLATDIMARYKKMKGFCVLHPIGWDSFGLPAEQYALKEKKDPNEFVLKNIDVFRKQLKNLNFSFDYSKEINTSDPLYYGTTQWIFAQMYKNNLAELQDTVVNWCPKLNTVLANEEIVEVDGQRLSERGSFPVEYKKLKQWILKISEYSEELLNDFSEVEWSEKIKKIQCNWIGKKEKYKFLFNYKNNEYFLFLERPEDIYKLKKIYVHEFSKLFLNLNLTKTPENKESLSIFLSNKFLTQEIEVLFLKNVDFREDDLIPEIDEDILIDEEKQKQLLELVKKGEIEKLITYKLKNWVFSRQRYWGEPFPIYYNKKGDIFLDENLPILLPKLTDFSIFFESKSSPLGAMQNWIKKDEEHTRDVNTMPNWAGSSWYFLGYLLKNTESNSYLKIDSEEAKKIIARWMPVDIYVGGQEHANLHLLYARFWYKFLNKLNITKNKEPFKKLINQGMILSEDGTKMSKSKGNVVNTENIVSEYGGDLLRLNIAFMGPTELTQKWDGTQLLSLKKWLQKIYESFVNLSSFLKVEDSDSDLLPLEVKLLKNVENAIEKWCCNIIVSELMIAFNSIIKLQKYSTSFASTFVKILSFLAPAFAEELWQEVLKNKSSVFLADWPNIKNEQKEFEISIQINNKFKFTHKVLKDMDKEEIFKLISTLPRFIDLIQGKEIKKYFVIPNKTINIIID